MTPGDFTIQIDIPKKLWDKWYNENSRIPGSSFKKDLKLEIINYLENYEYEFKENNKESQLKSPNNKMRTPVES